MSDGRTTAPEAERATSRDEELERAYAELRRTQADLVNTARMATLGNLIRGVVHEINTPLGALKSNHDVAHRALARLQGILEDEVVEADELDEVRRIVRAIDGVQETNVMAVERMERLVQDLRSFGRPDRSEIASVSLAETLDNTLRLLKHELGDRIAVVREYDDELGPVQCHPHRLSQVFMNLLVNAVHAIEGPGTITVRARRRGEEAVIEIEDTGVGIPMKNAERIFEPGFTTKGSRVGMGLGLLISKQIVDEHRGRISVQSQVGEGTTFTVALPLTMKPDEAPPPTTP